MNKKTILAFLLVGIIIILWPLYEEKVLGIKRGPRQKTEQQIPVPAEKQENGADTKITLPKEPPRQEKPKEKIQRADTLVFETDLVRGMVSSKGGGTIISWKLKKFLDPTGKTVELVPDSSSGNLGMAIGGSLQEYIDLSNTVFRIVQNRKTIEGGKTVHTLAFSHDVPGMGRIDRILSVREGSYDVQLRVHLVSTDPYRAVSKWFLFWKGGIAPTEKNTRDESSYLEASAMHGDEMLKTKSDSTGLREGTTSWASVRTKYFIVSMIPQNTLASAIQLKGEKIQIKDAFGNLVPWKKVTATLVLPLKGAQQDSSSIVSYFGPMDYRLLKAHGVSLEKNMNFGWIVIRPFSIAFMYAFEFLFGIIRNYGWAIIVFAIMIKIILNPLMKKSMDSMKKMQSLQPKIEAMREKYKNDPQKMNAETMKMYKEYGINPFGGCLPFLLQMPILFALFNLFRTTIMLRQATFGPIQDLSAPDQIIPIGNVSLNLLPILMGVSMILQQRLTVQDPKQKFTTYFMSIFMIYIFYSLSSGLNLYYLVFNILQIGQELAIRRRKPKEAVQG